MNTQKTNLWGELTFETRTPSTMGEVHINRRGGGQDQTHTFDFEGG